MLVTPSTDPQNWLAFTEFISTSRVFALEDVQAGDTFYPRRVDGYADELRIDYWLTQPAQVTASIVDRDGREMALLTRNHRMSGANRMLWDGRTDAGRGAPAGRYRARLVATNLSGEELRSRVGFQLADLVPFSPGRAGPARGGMTKRAAMATGAFRSNVRHTVPGVCTTVYPLVPRAPHDSTYSLFVRDGRIVEMTAVRMEQVRLPRGLRAGATARQVRRAFPGRLTDGEAGYANNALFLEVRQNWMAFVFDSFTYRRDLRSDDELAYVSVAVGRRPDGLQHDGC